jgi:hypothetical protein
VAARTDDPHSACGCDPESGEPRGPLPPVPDEDVTAARAAAAAERYRILDDRANVPDVRKVPR